IEDEYKERNKVATDLLMCCGEFISSVIMSDALYKEGINATPLTGGQAGIITNNNFGDAKYIDVKTQNILEALAQNKVPVVTGFQGITEDGFFTTLGRGGSDTSAAILGAALKAEGIEIYTDVDGIMTADPRIVKDAVLIGEVSYSEVFQLADQGAKVIHPKAVDIAMKGNIPLYIKNTMSDCVGTLINAFGDRNTSRLITGITSTNNRIQVIIRVDENKGNEAYREVLELLANNNISLDLINIFPKEQIFTIDKSRKKDLENILGQENLKYELIENCSTIAVVGAGMHGIPGVMAKIIRTLSDNNINVLQTADSNMTIWCLINTDDVEKGINVLHKSFELS
ncbi:MAG: aspartate kinase, partial [Clostridium sp.]